MEKRILQVRKLSDALRVRLKELKKSDADLLLNLDEEELLDMYKVTQLAAVTSWRDFDRKTPESLQILQTPVVYTEPQTKNIIYVHYGAIVCQLGHFVHV